MQLPPVEHAPWAEQLSGQRGRGTSGASHAAPVQPSSHSHAPPTHRPWLLQFPAHASAGRLQSKPAQPGAHVQKPRSQLPRPLQPEMQSDECARSREPGM